MVVGSDFIKLQPVVKEDAELVKSKMDDIAKKMEEYGTGYITALHVGIPKAFIVVEGILGTGQLVVACNPKYIGTGKKINTVETFLTDNLNYMCNRFKSITAVFESFNMKGDLVRITKNLTGEKAIAFQHMTDYLYDKLRGHPLEKSVELNLTKEQAESMSDEELRALAEAQSGS